MKKILAVALLALPPLAAHAEYEQIKLTVFGMDCAPCAHAIHVSMKGIQGVDTVDVDLNTGLVSIKLTHGNNAAMRQFNQAVEKNGFTHKDAVVVARGKVTGTAGAPFFEVAGTQDLVLWVSALIWSGGFFVAYLLGPILERMDR
jgi:cation transport ATPase